MPRILLRWNQFERRQQQIGVVLSPCRSTRPPRHMTRDASLLLRVADDAEQIARLGIAARADHADQALGLRAGASPSFSNPTVAVM